MPYKELPKAIYFESKVGSNGIHCLDYKNESSIMYIRADVVKQMLKEHYDEQTASILYKQLYK